MKTIKFDGLHSDLKDLHHFLFSKDANLQIDEEYKSTPGINKEPDVTSLIISGLSAVIVPIVKAWLKEYFNYKKEKINKISISEKKNGEYHKVENVDDITES